MRAKPLKRCRGAKAAWTMLFISLNFQRLKLTIRSLTTWGWLLSHWGCNGGPACQHTRNRHTYIHAYMHFISYMLLLLYIYIYTCPCVHVSSWAGWKYAHVLSVHRCTAQADEDTRHWALQPLDDFLPSWMSLEVELKICQFIEQNASWQARIDKRSSEGKELTQTQQSRYDAWLLGCEPRLVFSKERQKLVTDAGQIKDDCICLTLHLSDDPDKLLVTSSAGKEYRLVLLKGSKSEEDAGLEARIAFDFFLFCVHIIYIYTYTYICIYIYIFYVFPAGGCALRIHFLKPLRWQVETHWGFKQAKAGWLHHHSECFCCVHIYAYTHILCKYLYLTICFLLEDGHLEYVL